MTIRTTVVKPKSWEKYQKYRLGMAAKGLCPKCGSIDIGYEGLAEEILHNQIQNPLVIPMFCADCDEMYSLTFEVKKVSD